MAILSIDTSSKMGSIAVFEKEKFFESWNEEKSHAELLSSKIKNLLDKLNIAPTSLKNILVNIGPGSFTGIRIAVNTAKALSYTTGANLIPYVTHDLYSKKIPASKNNLFIALDAHSGKYYCSQHIFDKKSWIRTKDLFVCSEEEVLKLKNSECLMYSDKISSFLSLSKIKESSNLALIMLEDFLENPNNSSKLLWSEIEPLYIRPSSPEEKRDILDLGHKRK